MATEITIDVSVEKLSPINLGRQGENDVEMIHFNIQKWQEEFGSGDAYIFAKRKGDAEPYPVVLDITDNIATWTLNAGDTAYKGKGTAQLSYIVNDQVKKTIIFKTVTMPSIMATTEQPPEPYYTWLNTISDTTIDTVTDTALESLSRLQKTSVIDTLTDLIESEYAVGEYVQTRGFASATDNGGGLYKIETKPNDFTPDNCTTFVTDYQRVARRVFTEPFVYLESLNIGTVSYATINSVIASNGIHDVRANQITISEPIEIVDYDLTFDAITYTGEDTAILLDGVGSNKIVGNSIAAASGTCITMTSDARSCTNNVIDVRVMTGINGLMVLPTNGNGISKNTYRFGYVNVTQYGLRTYIPSNTGSYSWQGEELYSVETVNAGANGRGVSFEIDDVSDVTEDGTITGVTFTNLSVEGSDTGVYIKCGDTQNSLQSEACIKSIIINNMRVRETNETETFLYAHGWIKDVYIKPTSPIKLSQWDLNVTSYNRLVVDAPVFTTNVNKVVGDTLCCRAGKTYICNAVPSNMNVSANTDFSGLDSSSSLFITRMFRCTANVTVDLTNYYYDESLENLLFGVSAGKTVTVKLPDVSQDLVLDNSASADMHLFIVNCMRNANAQTQLRVFYSDLGKNMSILNN